MDCAAPVDWSEVLADLDNPMPVPCPFALANGGSACEVCDEDLDGTDFDRHEFPDEFDPSDYGQHYDHGGE